MAEIDTTNKQAVGMLGDRIIVVMPAPTMTPDEAMAFVAYLVTMAEMDATHLFEDVLRAVQDA